LKFRELPGKEDSYSRLSSDLLTGSWEAISTFHSQLKSLLQFYEILIALTHV